MSKSCGYTGAVILLWASACTAQQFKIDGYKDDWAAIPAAINEVGMSGTAEDWEIDVKQVFFSAGPSNLYVFLSCFPSVKEAMGKNRDPRRICEMYFDVDNDFTTGSTRETNPQYGDIVGYERQMIVDTIIRNRTNVFAHAHVLAPDESGRFNQGETVIDCEIDYGKKPLTYGPDGIELALPLKKMQMSGRGAIRVLVMESAHASQRAGFTETVVRLSGSGGETKPPTIAGSLATNVESRLALIPGKKEYKAGEQIDLRVELRNPSNERWVVKEAPDPYVNHLPLFDVFIRGIGNDGRQYMNVMALVEPYLKTSVAVEGGEVRTWNLKASTQEKFLNGTPYGEEVPPGKYKLFVDGARMKSPEVEITINGP